MVANPTILLCPHGAPWRPGSPLVNYKSLSNWSAVPASEGRKPRILPLPALAFRCMLSSPASPDPIGVGSSESSPVDREAFEAERLRLDASARDSMAVTASASEESDDGKAWKWRIRKRIWDLMEAVGIARNPRPVHHRIPNFVGAPKAAEFLARLEDFQKALCVKVNPDSPQKQVRFLTLTGLC
ncbi:hypothetical protein HPP92_003998 [Vanilla planifolia]|uniref:Uncharacterized protein n=1 Tax=Vanilla planifolia TaxID=51239 RepID=A0A835SCZ7_VANPL|nr:hypothetical protein HPP92_003998 [Vanilla planifolia]